MADTPKKLKDLKVADLKVELEKRGLEKNGLKADLIERLRVAVEEEGHDPDEYFFNDEEGKIEDNELNEGKMQSRAEEAKNEESNEDMIFSEELANTLTCVDQIENVEENDNLLEETETGNKENDNQENVEDTEDSLKIMIGDEDNLFEDENENKETGVNGVIHASPPRPETVPAKHPFTSKDTISLSSRSGKAPSDNSSMLVNPDECSLASHDSGMGRETDDKNGNDKDDSDKQVASDVVSADKKEETSEEKKKNVSSSSRNLWVSGLSSTTRATDLKSVFSKHGKVAGAKVVTNAMTAGARCYGYVTMGSSEDAAKCIQHLNKTELHGRMITVERARGESGSSKAAEASKKADDQKRDGEKKEEKKEDSKKDTSTTRKDSKDEKKPERHRITAPEGSSSSSRREGERSGHTSTSSTSSRSGSSYHSSGRRDERRPHGHVLTFHQIKDQRRRELEKEEERRRRDRERRRREEDRLRREREEEEHRLRREREDLRRERERLEREKQELMKFERERQRQERERLEREKEELERLRRQQSSRVEETRRVTKRPVDEREPYYGDRKRGREDYGRSGGREQAGQGYSRSGAGFDRRPQEERSSGSRYESGRGGGRDGRVDQRGNHSSHSHGNSSRGHGNSSHGHGNSSHGHGNSSHGHGDSSHGSHASHGHSSSHGHGGGGGGGGSGGNAWAGKSTPSFGVGGSNNFNQVQGMDQDWPSRGGVSGNGGLAQQARPLLGIAGVPIGVRPFGAGIQQQFGGLAGPSGGQERYDQYRQQNNMMNQRRY